MEDNPAMGNEALPTRIGDYRVVRRLGRGGKAQVMLARDEREDRFVAIRCLGPGKGLSAHGRRRFQRAIDAASKLEHATIARIYGQLEADDQDYVIMEFVPGRTLASLLQDASLDQGLVVRVIRQILEGLELAHGRGVIHQDLKMENVILDKDGMAKILGFGMASRAGLDPDITDEDPALYARSMSPEQAHGDPVDHRTDFFSLGVMIYELVSKVNPFQGKDLTETLYNIQHQLHVPLGQNFPGVHNKLSALVDWLLQKDPERRPENVGDMEMALDEIVNDVLGADAI